MLNAGLGMAASWHKAPNVSESPAFGVSYERGFATAGPVTLGAGAYLGYQSIKANYSALLTNYRSTASSVFGSIRGTSHYAVAPKVDVYGALGFSIRYRAESSGISSAVYGGTASLTDLVGVALVGGRYYFLHNIGAFAEVGYDQTYFKFGGALKF